MSQKRLQILKILKMALASRSLSSSGSAPPVSLVARFQEHTFQNDEILEKCWSISDLFSPHLDFFGGNLDIAYEAVRGFILLDEADKCPYSTMGRPIPWRELESPPPLSGIPLSLHEQFLDSWVKIPVVHGNNIEYVEDAFNDDVTLFHGTISKSAKKIVDIGFLPGPNGKVKNRKYYEGAFMSKGFSPACYRSDMTRHVREDLIYEFESCPCVLEMRTSSALLVNYHKHNPDLFVLPGSRGKVLQGLRIEAIHFNTRFVQNYRALHSPELRAQIKAHGGVLETICGGLRQLKDFSTCGAVSFDPYSDFMKLGKHRFCPKCHALWQ